MIFLYKEGDKIAERVIKAIIQAVDTLPRPHAYIGLTAEEMIAYTATNPPRIIQLHEESAGRCVIK